MGARFLLKSVRDYFCFVRYFIPNENDHWSGSRGSAFHRRRKESFCVICDTRVRFKQSTDNRREGNNNNNINNNSDNNLSGS